MNIPPRQIDNADILEWAWSGNKLFGIIKYRDSDEIVAEIFGLAICKYKNSDAIYRFSCDKN